MNEKGSIVGISCYYHDAAAAIVVNGGIIAAAQEERFSRVKHDPRFPVNALNYCLEEARIDNSEINAVAYYDNPFMTFDRILSSLAMGYPESCSQWTDLAPSFLSRKMHISDRIKNYLMLDVNVLFCEHHFSHAASAFYPSPFQRAAILTVDGVGEWATTTLGYGEEENINILKEIHYPNSLGLLYSAFTYYCGFKVNSGEYKLMGLAPYGEPKYTDLIYDNLIDVLDDGSFKLNMGYFSFHKSQTMINDKFADLFGGPSRKSESRIDKRIMDVAASIQKVTEDIVLRLAKHAKKITKMDHLVLAGGVALNCVANGVILRNRIFSDLWIQPASGDAGGALGAALLVAHQYSHCKRLFHTNGFDSQKGSYLGIGFSNEEVQSFINTYSIKAHKMPNDSRASIIAKQIVEGKIIGYFSGRMEYGPRALGARSIIADPRKPDMQKHMNLKIKYRESFRPFAPAVLREKVSDYFELDSDSPYMLLVAPVKEKIRLDVPSSENIEDLLNIVNQERSTISAVTHVDYSARIQTVHKETNPKFYDIIKEFHALTGCAVVINTSFNVRGEPLVCTPKDAYICFMRTSIDILILEDYILYKEEQPTNEMNDKWKESYVLD